MKKLLKYFDTLKFSYKANFLIFIIAGGMISIIVLSQISIFILKAVQGYVKLNDYTTPHTYIVDTDRNKVYADVYEEISGITVEEIIENADKAGEELIEPIYEIEDFELRDDSFSFQYDSKIVEFTALSGSYYENQDGVRYTIDSHSGIEEYIESFFE